MRSVTQFLRPVARRADLLRAGFTDRDIRRELAARSIFRVRHGWYARVGTADAVVRAVRVGGVLSGIEALRVRGVFLPPPARVDIVVPHNASGLRSPGSHRRRLSAGDGLRIHWIDGRRRRLPPSRWLASEDDALVLVLHIAPRDTAVAACDAVVRYLGWSPARLDAAFARAPRRVRAWRALVDGRADSWGETVLRLRLRDAGITMEPQARVPGAGAFDGRVSAGVYLEVDGGQHAEDWDGEGGSRFERDHQKDLVLAQRGARSIRLTYAQLMGDWAGCLAAIRAAMALDDRARARRAPRRPARLRKLRTITLETPARRANRRPSSRTSSVFVGEGPQPAARAPNVRR
ncbi:MAG TPA: hypothetical protein VNR36_13985 [Pseudolysinimonas sp.]|nr:hypothetical protein [Pseudolysinimonas sp.]